eukprot:5197939-Amphidinium_carterae.1
MTACHCQTRSMSSTLTSLFPSSDRFMKLPCLSAYRKRSKYSRRVTVRHSEEPFHLGCEKHSGLAFLMRLALLGGPS